MVGYANDMDKRQIKVHCYIQLYHYIMFVEMKYGCSMHNICSSRCRILSTFPVFHCSTHRQASDANFSIHSQLHLAKKLVRPKGCVDKPRAPFKSQYIQQYVLKSHQVWCQIKAWVLNFLGMSLDMKIRLKLSEICKET